MGRPKTINALVQEIAVEAVRRIKVRQAAEPEYQLTERDAKVIKTLAEAQVTLQKRKPEEGGQEESAELCMSIEELEQATADKPEPPVAGAVG